MDRGFCLNEIGRQLPEKLRIVHAIETDDPIGIEAYWHKQFENQRKNGEWFEFFREGIRAYKRRRILYLKVGSSMPTVLRDGPYCFVFFSSDREEPVHIHVKRDRHIAK